MRIAENARPALRPVRRSAEALVRRPINRLGYELTRRSFYSALPDIASLPKGWEEPTCLIGVDLRLNEALRLLSTSLQPYLDEFRPPELPPGQFWLRNGSYGIVDAPLLYAMVRYLRPKRLYELGSGCSSHVIRLAERANTCDNDLLEHTIFDPFPFYMCAMGKLPDVTVIRERTEDLDPALFDELQSGDILFVDTTHTVRTGGDVPHIFLEILPRLASGVIIHVHDIFLPYEYPREWVIDQRQAWGEQYLLQAFLAFNDTFEVLLPNYALTRTAPESLRRLIPTFHPEAAHPEAGGFWMKRL